MEAQTETKKATNNLADFVATTNGQQKQKQQQQQQQQEGAGQNLDSGYAWLILLVMFLLQANIGGAARVYGIVYAKEVAIGYYDREQASWPIATASSVENLASVLVPALATRLSWRQIQLLSSSLFVASNLLAYLSDSLQMDILALGVCQGLALSTYSVLSLAINNDYFERFRTTAYGISMSGSTFGVLYLSPLVSWLLAEYGDHFRCVYLALAGMFCANVVLVLFIRPRAETIKLSARRAADFSSGGESAAKTSLAHQPPPPPPIAATTESANSAGGSIMRKNQSHLSLKSAAAHLEASPGNGANHRDSISRKISVCVERHLERVSSVASISDLSGQLRRQSTIQAHRPHAAANDARLLDLCLQEVGAGASCTGSCEAFSRRQRRQRRPSRVELRQQLVTLEQQQPYLNEKDEHQKQKQQQQQQKQESVEFSLALVGKLLLNPYLHCTWMMLALYYLISRIFVIILVDFATDHGHSLAASTALLNYWSLGELIGRILLGSLIDLNWLSCRACIGITCALLAGSISAMIVVENYYIYAVCSILVAALSSLEYMLINVLMIDYLGKHYVTSCYSIAAFLSSLLLFARPSLIGLFRDHLGTYDGLLGALALSSLVFALLFTLLEPLLVRKWPKGAPV